jgi:hypothetical protein
MKNVANAHNQFNSCVLIFLMCFGSISARAQQTHGKAITPTQGAAETPSSDLIQPAELATILNAAKEGTPLIFQVGLQALYTQAHITGSEYIGPSSSPEGIERLRKRVEPLPRTQFIVLYCGCCPWSKCPNVTPAYNALRGMGFKKLKVLYIPNDFGTDWVDKGYPVHKGE